MFSSDYPHWDFDDPRHVLTTLPAEIRDRVKAQNAIETYGRRL
jgi:predicted TIM-barrel fold metal-dependent hydrolase